MKDLRIKQLAIVLSLLLIGCQETEITPEEPEDPDMDIAMEITDEYFSTSRRKKSKADITVLKYKKEDLIYKTNKVKGGYHLIDEMTVTAETRPGGYVIWHAGGGVKKLLDIEFDEASEEMLGDERPFSIRKNKTWILHIPDDFDPAMMDELKYDIVYETKDRDVIRLDPKIKIRQSME